MQADTVHTEDGGFSLVEVFNVLLEYRRVIVAVPLVLFVFVVGKTLLKPRTYSTSAAFVAQGPESATSNFSGLAAQFGVSIPTSARSQSPEFYSDLLTSRAILGGAVDSKYTVDGRTADLAEFLRIKEKSPQLRRDLAIEALHNSMSTSVGRATGIVHFTVSTRSAELSEQIGKRIVALVNEFDLNIRQTEARAQRQFIEARMNAAKKEKTEAEARLASFLQGNRVFESSPTLNIQFQRLQSEAMMRQQVYTEMAAAYEKARIDEVRNTPVITVLEAPERAVRPDRRGTVMKGIVALILGAGLGLFVAFALAFTSRDRRRKPAEFQRFVDLRSAAIAPFAKPFKLARIRTKA